MTVWLLFNWLKKFSSKNDYGKIKLLIYSEFIIKIKSNSVEL